MKVIAVLARKGGSGKTTLAVHLGVLAQAAGRRVLFFDLDPQRSLGSWWDSREADTPPLVQTDARRLGELVKVAGAEGYDVAVVDTPPAVTFDTARVAEIADLAIVPLRPSILDIRAVADTVSVVQATRTRLLLVLNSVLPPTDAGEARTTTDAREALGALGAPVADTALAQRLDYTRALNGGEAVNEFAPDSRAAAEVARLWREVEDMIR